MWQDYVIAVVQWVFAAALVPTILDSRGKPPLATSALTAVGLYVLGGTFFTLGLWQSGISTCAAAGAWTIIGIQRFRLNRVALQRETPEQ